MEVVMNSFCDDELEDSRFCANSSRTGMVVESRRARRQIIIGWACTCLAVVAIVAWFALQDWNHRAQLITADEGRARLLFFLEGTTKQLEVTGWVDRSVAVSATDCELWNGDIGAQYEASIEAESGVDPVQDSERVTSYWESLDMEVQVVRHGAYPTPYASGGPVLRATFHPHFSTDDYASGRAYLLIAIAPCSPGDAFELNKRDRTARDHGREVPGDEYRRENSG